MCLKFTLFFNQMLSFCAADVDGALTDCHPRRADRNLNFSQYATKEY